MSAGMSLATATSTARPWSTMSAPTPWLLLLSQRPLWSLRQLPRPRLRRSCSHGRDGLVQQRHGETLHARDRSPSPRHRRPAQPSEEGSPAAADPLHSPGSTPDAPPPPTPAPLILQHLLDH